MGQPRLQTLAFLYCLLLTAVIRSEGALLVHLLLMFVENRVLQYSTLILEQLMLMNTGLLLLILTQCNSPEQVS